MQKPLIRSASNPRKVAAVLVACILLLLPSLAGAEWYKDYESAMDLIKKGLNVEAIPKLQAAISQKNTEGGNIKFYGMKFGDYFPHYYLGMAYFSQKNYEAAVREFEISESNGAIQRKSDLYSKMNSVRTLARAQISIKTQPEIAQNNPPVTIPVTPPPQETKPEEKKITDLQVQKPPVTTTPTENTTTTQIKKEEKPPVIAAPPVDAGAEAVKLMLKSGARKYFEGDYDGAISSLASALEVNPNEASAHFMLGCAYASKYLLSGSENKDFFKNASSAFQKLKKINPGYKPRNKAYFSPAVLDLYSKT